MLALIIDICKYHVFTFFKTQLFPRWQDSFIFLLLSFELRTCVLQQTFWELCAAASSVNVSGCFLTVIFLSVYLACSSCLLYCFLPLCPSFTVSLSHLSLVSPTSFHQPSAVFDSASMFQMPIPLLFQEDGNYHFSLSDFSPCFVSSSIDVCPLLSCFA